MIRVQETRVVASTSMEFVPGVHINGHDHTSVDEHTNIHNLDDSNDDSHPNAYVLAPWRSTTPNTILTPAEIDFTLQHFANPQSIRLYGGPGLKADVLNFQPCEAYKSQDRYVVEQWDILGQMWTMSGVFDGHLGDATVEHTAKHLPIIIRQHLSSAITSNTNPDTPLTSSTISTILQSSISSFDDAIARDVLELIPGGLASLDTVSDEDIQAIINDHDRGGENFYKARLCMYGTTALVALVDPGRENLWVANLGDSQAVLASRSPSNEWTAELLTRPLNGSNPSEVDRVRAEHPGENTCVKNQRVLGAIAPFRTIGDTPFKMPPSFTRRILYNLKPTYDDKSLWEEFLRRNITPPYISSLAEITHRKLSPSTPDTLGIKREHEHTHTVTGPDHFLILATDGLGDLYEELDIQDTIDAYVKSVVYNSPWSTSSTPASQPSGHAHHDPSPKRAPKEANLALAVLKEALGGSGDTEEDLEAVSSLLTPNLDEQWMDDVTIVVQVL